MSSKRRNSAPQIISRSEVPCLREHLSRSDLFSSCTEDVQDSLMTHFHYRPFHSGEYLIQSGNKASTLFILLKGQVQVVSEKYEAVLAELGPGMIFGEIGALFGVARTASVVAKSTGLVAIIDKTTLKEVIGHDRVLWNHIKGIAMTRYRLTSTNRAKKCTKLTLKEKEAFLKQVLQANEIVLKKISVLVEVKEFQSETIVDFFSPRAKHVLYLVKEGSLTAHYLSSPSKILNSGDIFKSYDKDLDFVKSLTNSTILFEIDVQQASAIFAEHDQVAGELLLGTDHLTDHIDANTSLQATGELGSIMNPAQFSRRRRNSTPIFTDFGKENGFKFVGIRESIPREVATTSSKLVNTDSDLKALLLNAGIVVPKHVTLLFDERLALTALKNDLTDSILLVILSVLGSQIKVLNLTDCHLLTSAGILVIWAKCPNLIKISLQGCWNLDDSAFSTLSRCACSETIKELNVSHCWRFTSKLFNFISDSPLTKLDLSYCKGLDDRTWPALTQFSKSLRYLKLARCLGVTDSSFEGVFGVQFGELEHLDLSECAFLTDSAVSSILASSPNLRTLNLSLVTSLKGSFLLHHEFLPNLRVLNLSYLTEVVDEAFCSRLCEVCANLEQLSLDGCNKIDDKCLSHLSSNLPNLTTIGLNNCPLISPDVSNCFNLKYKN